MNPAPYLHAIECLAKRLTVIKDRIPYQAGLNLLLAIYWLQTAAKMMQDENNDQIHIERPVSVLQQENKSRGLGMEPSH